MLVSGEIVSVTGFETMADPVSVRMDSSSASLASARFFDSMVVSTQPESRSSPVRALLASRFAAEGWLAPVYTKL